jgi:hypothetical protein
VELMDDTTAIEMATEALTKMGYGPYSVATILTAIHEAGLLIIEPHSFGKALGEKLAEAGVVRQS